MKTLEGLIKQHYQPKIWNSSCLEDPWQIPWKGEVVIVPASEAKKMIAGKLIYSCSACGRPEEKLQVKIEAMQWYFDEVGFPVIVRKIRQDEIHGAKTVYMITCRGWDYSAPTSDPLKVMYEIWDEMTECAFETP